MDIFGRLQGELSLLRVIFTVSWELLTVLAISTVALLSSDIFSASVGNVCAFPKVVSSILIFGDEIEEAVTLGTTVSGPVGSLRDVCS